MFAFVSISCAKDSVSATPVPEYLILLKTGDYLKSSTKPQFSTSLIIFVQDGTKRTIPIKFVTAMFQRFQSSQNINKHHSGEKEIAGDNFTKRESNSLEQESVDPSASMPNIEDSSTPLVLTDQTIVRSEANTYKFGDFEFKVEYKECKVYISHGLIRFKVTCKNLALDQRNAKVQIRVNWHNRYTKKEIRSELHTFSSEYWRAGSPIEQEIWTFMEKGVTCDQIAIDLWARQGNGKYILIAEGIKP